MQPGVAITNCKYKVSSTKSHAKLGSARCRYKVLSYTCQCVARCSHVVQVQSGSYPAVVRMRELQVLCDFVASTVGEAEQSMDSWVGRASATEGGKDCTSPQLQLILLPQVQLSSLNCYPSAQDLCHKCFPPFASKYMSCVPKYNFPSPSI